MSEIPTKITTSVQECKQQQLPEESESASIKQQAEIEKLDNQDKIPNVSKGNSLDSSQKERRRMKAEIWNNVEIKTIFKLYDEYGSQWKIMEAQFTDRTANSIKNRFYTAIRILLKNLFRQHSSSMERLPHEIPSKTILRFYEGRSEFARFRGFGRRILKIINYDLDSPDLKRISEENSHDIQSIYDTIFNNSAPAGSGQPAKKAHISRCKSQENLPGQNLNQSQNGLKSPKSMPGDYFHTRTDLGECNNQASPVAYMPASVYLLLPMTGYNMPVFYSNFNKF